VAYVIVGEASPRPARSKAPSGSPRNSPDKQIEGGPECSLIAEAAANGGDVPLAGAPTIAAAAETAAPATAKPPELTRLLAS